MIKRAHTYSDGSTIELGSETGKGWLEVLKSQHQQKRKVIGRKALRVTSETTTRPDREF